MDYGRSLTTAWHITWQHKSLWFFGFLAGINALSSSLLRLTFGPNLFRAASLDPEQLLNNPDLLYGEIDQLLRLVAPWLVGGTILLVALSLAAWLIILLAHGAIIGTAVHHQTTHPLTFRHALRQGWHLLGRFIAIDTLVYFPLFLILLFILLIFGGTLISTILSATQPNATTASFTTPLLLGCLCLLPLFCLTLPVGILTAAYRALAFRDTAVFHHGVRQTVRHTWAILKANIADILILGLLLWGLQYIIEWGLRLLTLPVYALTTAPGLLALLRHTTPLTATTFLSQFISVFIEAIILLIRAVIYTFTAVTWTIAYKEISNR
ncbi:MAG: hypothetical protein H6658_13870 [Ardenticatenaceae bacterium]|nr:hypothetical protein [Ardenticatenaceae bacterium]